MAIPRSLSWWLRLPSRVALILGMGAVSAAGAGADASEQTGFGGVLVRSEGGRIFLLEGGRETELRLGATPQRDHLLRLLEEHGPASIKLDHDPRLIMSSGGGTGFSLRDIQRSITGDPPSRDPPPPPVQKRDPAPRERKPASDKKK